MFDDRWSIKPSCGLAGMVLSAALELASPCGAAAPALSPGSVVEYTVGIPEELKDFDRSGRAMSARSVQVTVAVPVDFDPDREWPILLVSAASEATADSNRVLLRAYMAPAFLEGWVVVATDPRPAIARWEDNVSLRFVEALLAMDSLHDAWRNAGKAKLAFAGPGGGAKLSGWLAAMFASQRANVVGLFEAGEEDESLVPAAMQFSMLLDPHYLSIPIFMFLATDAESEAARSLRATQKSLRGRNYRNVEIGFGDPADASGVGSLRGALAWFRALNP